MSDPRIVIRDVLNDWILGPDSVDQGADSILADLTAAGFALLPPGGETREHLEVQTPGVRYPGGDREYIWRVFGDLMGRGIEAQVVIQDVTTWPDGREHRTPWRPVPGSAS